MRQLVLFQAGSTTFALDRNCISRIRPLPAGSIQTDTRVEQQIFEDDESNLLMIDLAAAASQARTPQCPPNPEMIVVKGVPPYALLSDSVGSTLEVSAEQFEDLPHALGDTARAYFPKVLCSEDHVALVIDPDALAVLNKHAEAFDDPSRARRTEPSEDKQMTVRQEEAPPSDPPSVPSAMDHFEAVVGEKLRQIIQQRVQEVTAETVARALKQHMEESVTPPQPWA